MNPLLIEQLLDDPRVRDARRTLLDTLRDHQQTLTAPKRPDPDRRIAYDQLITRFGHDRGGALYYPYLGSGAGRGALVELADGSVKYDMIGGIGVHGFGHGHPALTEAALDAALCDVVMQGNLQQDVASAELAHELIAAAGDRLNHVFLTTSGAMANENALKLIFQARHPADRLLAFEHCFMGRTLAMAAVTDKPAYRDGLPPTIDVDYVPFFDQQDPIASTSRAVATLNEHLQRRPQRYAAMCFEVVQGEGGYHVGDRDFFLALIDILKQHNVAVMIDEVQTFGRLHALFGFQHFGLDQHVDVVTIGKLSQVCATLFTDEFRPRPGLISQTFTGATASIHAGRAILRLLESGDYFGDAGRIAAVHHRFVDRFNQIAADHPNWIRGPHGLGGMIAFQVFDGTPDITKQVLHALYDAGVIAFLAGAQPTRVRFLPSIGVISDDDIDHVCRILRDVLTQTATTIS
ncbi:MAG: acetylornithine aminotransferase [Planctomycetaceae bacterium]|nr:acetylornithine aminotransferase [Planctomycetaceae bacterium]